MEEIASGYKLERMIDRVKSQSCASEARKFYTGYFLEGIRNEARKMIRATRKMIVTDVIYSIFPTFSLPFRQRIQESVSTNASVAFSSAKGLYDNLNRFLQSAYSQDDEIERRHQRIVASEKGFTCVVGDEFNLRKITQLRESGKLDIHLEDLATLNTITDEVVAPIRNAAEHGHGHAILKTMPEKLIIEAGSGFRITNAVSNNMPAHNVSGMAYNVSNAYIALAYGVLRDSIGRETK